MTLGEIFVKESFQAVCGGGPRSWKDLGLRTWREGEQFFLM